MFDILAANDGSGGTIWGPCTDGSKLNCDCPQCENVNRMHRKGLDWDDEYQKAKARNFDREDS